MNPIDMILELYDLAISLQQVTSTIFSWQIGPLPSWLGIGSYLNMFDLIVLMASTLFSIIIVRGIIRMVAV